MKGRGLVGSSRMAFSNSLDASSIFPCISRNSAYAPITSAFRGAAFLAWREGGREGGREVGRVSVVSRRCFHGHM